MEFTAKTVEEATETGLTSLGLKKEEAIITVIEEPVKGLFGKMKGQAVVSIIAKDGSDEKIKEDKAEEKKEIKKEEKKEVKKSKKQDKSQEETGEKEIAFVNKLLSFLELEAEVVYSHEGENEVLTLKSNDSSSLIGYRGEVLDAIQTLTGAYANIGKTEYRKVVVDCENYREKREDTLIKLANRLADKAVEKKCEVWLEPMNPFERRIIHTALADSETVTTKSEGKEPNRFVVIVPNDKDEFAKPYNAGKRNNDRSGYKKGGRNGKNYGERKSGFSEPKKKTSLSFGTYLGNSFKDKI